MITVAYTVDSSTAVLQWTPPIPQDHNGVIREYRINVTALNTFNFHEVIVTGTTAVIVSLFPSFTYHLSVSAHTVATGPYSPPVTITMPQDGESVTALMGVTYNRSAILSNHNGEIQNYIPEICPKFIAQNCNRLCILLEKYVISSHFLIFSDKFERNFVS